MGCPILGLMKRFDVSGASTGVQLPDVPLSLWRALLPHPTFIMSAPVAPSAVT
jgi:hypothetical protein